MKVIIAGSRTIRRYSAVRAAIYASGFHSRAEPHMEITEVVSGGAPGVDRLGEEWARDYNIPVRLFRADWRKYGRRAGPIRNGLMVEYAEALIAIWDGASRGTGDVIEQANKAGLPVYVHLVGVPAPALPTSAAGGAR